MSAVLLASLFTAIVAAPVSASASATSVGTFAAGTTSTGTLTFTLTELAANSLANAACSVTININDNLAVVPEPGVTFSGTPSTVGSTGSLGVSATVAGGQLTISWTNSDTANVEVIVVSGLKIAADALATPGPISAILGGACEAAFVNAASLTATNTATGVIQSTNTLASGADTADVLVTSVCRFDNTADSAVNSTATFSDAADARAVTGDSAGALTAAGVQVVTFAAGTVPHAAGVTVTQTVSQFNCNAVLGGTVIGGAVGNIALALAYTSLDGNPPLFPGENNQRAGRLQFVEPSAGFLASSSTLALKITTAGVLFSSPPTVAVTAGDAVVATPAVLSADRTTATVTVTTASTVASTIVVGGASLATSTVRYDVAATVTSGTLVTVEATASGGKFVNPATRTNGQVGRVFNASAPTPNLNIGQNGQVSGLITVTEATAGAFTAAPGPNNTFEVCLATSTNAGFTSPGPVATVTGGVAAGNLILREGAAASPDNIVSGTLDAAPPTGFNNCYYWTIWSASTTASTITIGSSATAGPLVNIPFGTNPGALVAHLWAGTLGTFSGTTPNVSLSIGNMVFASQVQVSAVSQPIIAPGALHASAGNIQVAETASGQLKATEVICVEIVPNQQTNILPDVFLSSLATSDVPVATATGGTVVGPVSVSTNTCGGLAGTAGNLWDSFSFTVLQQSTTGAGKVVISNIHYTAVNDAAAGPVQVNVWGTNAGANVDFQRVISNAVIGNPVAGSSATRLGVTQVGAFTTSTKVAKVGKYVTYRLDFGVSAAGKRVEIWGATKTGNDWSAFSKVTARIANASGVVYYYIRQNAATWKSYRGYFVDGGSWTPARQARWIR